MKHRIIMNRVFHLLIVVISLCLISAYDFENSLSNKDYERFEIMLSECNNVSDIQNAFGDTLLHMTVMYDQPDFLKRIMNLNQIDVNRKNNKNQSPLFYSVIFQSAPIADILLKKGAKIDELNSFSGYLYTPLEKAVMDDNSDLVKVLLEYKPNLDVKTVDLRHKGWDVLKQYFMKNKNLDVLNMLLEYGLKLNYSETAGCDLLFFSGLNKRMWKMNMKEMIVNGLDINSLNGKGFSYLMILSCSNFRNKYEVIRYFLEFKPDPNIKNNDGLTAYDLALKNEDDEMIKIISNYMNKYNKESISQSK